MMRLLLAVLLAVLAWPVMAAPQKVVSLNLCTDQLAASMLTPERLKGVSFNAADPALSLVAGVAQDYPLLKGTAEEMAEIAPDLVLLAEGQNPQLQQWLDEKQIASLALGAANTIAEVQGQVDAVAAALGEPQYAANLRKRQNILLKQTRLPKADMRVAVYYPRGFTDGSGTLIHDLIDRMGGKNIAAEQGVKSMGYLSLEMLVALEPDLLIIPLYDYDVASQAEELSKHPALKELKAQVVPLPGQYLTCPHLGLEAVVNAIAAATHEPAQ